MEAASSQMGIGNPALVGTAAGANTNFGGTPSAAPSPTAPIGNGWMLPPSKTYGAPPVFVPQLQTEGRHPWPAAPLGTAHNWFGYGYGGPGAGAAAGAGVGMGADSGVGMDAGAEKYVYTGSSYTPAGMVHMVYAPAAAEVAPSPPVVNKKQVFEQNNPTLVRVGKFIG